MSLNILCRTYGHSEQPPLATGNTKTVKGVIMHKHTIECSSLRGYSINSTLGFLSIPSTFM